MKGKPKDDLLPVIEAFLKDQPHLKAADIGRMATGRDFDKNMVFQMRKHHRRLGAEIRMKVIDFIMREASEQLRKRLQKVEKVGGHVTLELA